MGSLGLENVEADPNAIPDGKYDGVVFKSEYVLSETKDTVSHVITYKVTDGDHNGAQRQEWFQIGKAPRTATGEFPKNASEIAAYEGVMTENNKTWYKKRFVDLGIPEDQVHLTPVEALVGKTVTFGVKRNQGFININFVELRDASTTSQPQGMTVMPQSLGAQPPAAPAPATATEGVNPIAGGLV